MDTKTLHFCSPGTQNALISPPMNPRKESQKKEQENEITGGDAMMIIDFKNLEKNPTSAITVEEENLLCAETEIYDVTFLNIPILRIDDKHLTNCHFVDCDVVYLTDCALTYCILEKINTIYADRTPINECGFVHLRCDNQAVLCVEDCQISGCTFRDVELLEGAYLIDGVGDTWVEQCAFENVRTCREDRELCFCQERTGKLFKKTKQFCIIDEESCAGLDTVSAPDKGDVMEKGIGCLNLSVKAFNCLARAQIKTVKDLVDLDASQIMQIPNVGQLTISEVASRLNEHGITDTSWAHLR